MKRHRPLSAIGLLSPIVLLFCASVSARPQTSGANQWTWMGGSSKGNAAGVYGTLGVAASSNVPGSRVDAVSWTDKSGHLWLFGGNAFVGDTSQVLTSELLNDLWEFDPASSHWTWMAGGSTVQCGANGCGNPGTYGSLGTPSPGNSPGGRSTAMSWTDSSGKLWLYGGDGFDSIGQIGVLSDLWEFDPSTREWTWMGGNTTVPGNDYGQPGVYGTQGVAAAGNNPGALFFASSWTDRSGDAWLFGGWGYDANGENGFPINLWKFDPAIDEWAWIRGDSTFGKVWIDPAVYGAPGVPAAGNTPGGRWLFPSWTDGSGRLWLFGGEGFDANSHQGLLNELWNFDPATGEWVWKAGDSVMSCAVYGTQNCGQPGKYGSLGVASAANLPGGHRSSASWTGKDGNFWLFGGIGFDANGVRDLQNDLWMFDPTTGEWTWMGGASTENSGAPVYGALGVAAAGNLPGRRQAAVSWTDASGDFWMFGGNGLDATGSIGILNDLWRYQPASATVVPPGSFSMAAATTSLTVPPGQDVGTTLTITSQNGFSSPINFSCSGLPQGASCAFSPATVTPAGGTGSTSLTISTTGTSTARGVLPSTAGPGLLTSALASVFCWFGFRRRRKMLSFFLLFASLSCSIFLAGCGSGSLIPSPVPSPSTVTVKVVGVSGTLQQSVAISLTLE